jgi:hypothetical protein
LFSVSKNTIQGLKTNYERDGFIQVDERPRGRASAKYDFSDSSMTTDVVIEMRDLIIERQLQGTSIYTTQDYHS